MKDEAIVQTAEYIRDELEPYIIETSGGEFTKLLYYILADLSRAGAVDFYGWPTGVDSDEGEVSPKNPEPEYDPWDGLFDRLKKEQDKKWPAPKPYEPYLDTTTQCQQCGLTFDGISGYVCTNQKCPLFPRITS